MLTKVDRIETGNESKWLSMLSNEEERLNHGWFAVKQPSPQELHVVSREDARASEDRFFANTMPWQYVDSRLRSRLGTPHLTQHLSKLLSDLIQQR